MVTYGSARQRALSKRNEADKRRRAEIKAKEQNARKFDILSSAGTPPTWDRGHNRYGGVSSGQTGWGYTGYVKSQQRSGETWGKNIFFQYQEGYQIGGGRRVGQWDTRDVKISYTGADDWQRQINSAFWSRQSRQAEVAKVKEIQANVMPWADVVKSQSKYWSGRTGGLSAETQGKLASEASRAGSVSSGSGVKESFKTASEKAAENAKPPYDPTQDWLDQYNTGKPESMVVSKDDLSNFNFGGTRKSQVESLLETKLITPKERQYLEMKLNQGLAPGDESTYSDEMGRIMNKYSKTLSGVPGASRQPTTTYLGVSSTGGSNAMNNTRMNKMYNDIISKSPSIDVDISSKDRDVVLQNFIDKQKELTDREFEIKQQLGTGQILTEDGTEVYRDNFLQASSLPGMSLDDLKKEKGGYMKPTLEMALLKTQLESVKDKQKALSTQKAAFMTNEEGLLEANRINTEATIRKEAMSELKDYTPFKQTYGDNYLSYLNPEDVSGFYERSKELPRMTATSVSSLYYGVLGGQSYDEGMFEKYSTQFDPETDIWIKTKGYKNPNTRISNAPLGTNPIRMAKGGQVLQDGYTKIPKEAIDKFGAIDFSKLDDEIKNKIKSGDVTYVGYSKTQQRAYELGFDAKASTINYRTAEQQRITDDSTKAWLTQQYQIGQSEADYTDINLLSEQENFMDSRGRLRDPDRYGQAMGRLYYSTRKEIPKVKVSIDALQGEVDVLRVEKKALDATHSDYRKQISAKQQGIREKYTTTGTVPIDEPFIEELSEFAGKRNAARLALNIKEQKLDKLKKNLAATEEELESLKKQKSDWLPTTDGGGGRIVNPARFAKLQMLAGYSTTSVMSSGERSARAQVRQRQVARSSRKPKQKIRMIGQYGRTKKEGWDDTFSSFDTLAGLKRERVKLFRTSGGL